MAEAKDIEVTVVVEDKLIDALREVLQNISDEYNVMISEIDVHWTDSLSSATKKSHIDSISIRSKRTF